MTIIKTLVPSALLAAVALHSGVAMAQVLPPPVPVTALIVVQPEAIKWYDHPSDTAKLGVKVAIVAGDPRLPGLYVERLRFPPHVMNTPHSHGGDRAGMVLKGTWYIGLGPDGDKSKAVAIKEGGVILEPRDEVHFDGAGDEEVIVQIVNVGPSAVKRAHAGDPSFRLYSK
jgi:quercetin dioxygenase-like cupin family protein